MRWGVPGGGLPGRWSLPIGPRAGTWGRVLKAGARGRRALGAGLGRWDPRAGPWAGAWRADFWQAVAKSSARLRLPYSLRARKLRLLTHPPRFRSHLSFQFFVFFFSFFPGFGIRLGFPSWLCYLRQSTSRNPFPPLKIEGHSVQFLVLLGGLNEKTHVKFIAPCLT